MTNVQIWRIIIPKIIPKYKPVAVAYKEGGANLQEIPIDDDLLSWFPDGVHKIYVKANVIKFSLNIVERVEDKEW